MRILVVGAGLFGATVARLLADKGHRITVLEQRDHIAGNCHSENVGGIDVHTYGPHIFHTSRPEVWDFANRYASFRPYHHRILAHARGRMFSLPINLHTMHELWGVSTPEEARAKLAEVRHAIAEPASMEEQALATIGEELYELLIKPYTIKQWDKHPRDLPAFILKRLPVRFTWNDNYTRDRWTGIPQDGYTTWIDAMLDGCDIRLQTDFFADRDRWEGEADRIVYTGRLDRFFDHCHGYLEYRSLRFDIERLELADYQGTAIVNYPGEDVPFTRIVEHKHFNPVDTEHTVITREYPQAWEPGRTPFYPVNTDRNVKLGATYKEMAREAGDRYLFGGRLADYRYYDMDQTIHAAMEQVAAWSGERVALASSARG